MTTKSNEVSNGSNGHSEVPADLPPHLSSLKVNQSRLMSAIHTGCDFGAAHRYGTASTETGMNRLSLNDDDAKIRAWFLSETRALGCTTSVDQMGNLFAIRPGTSPSLPPIMMGSHLDTQPTGGRYDGILGVNAGLEVLRVLAENSIQTTHPIGVVDWTNEEGARFPMMAVASGVWAEAVPLETAWSLAEVTASEDGTKKTMKEELTRIGYLGDLPATYKSNPFAAHFELHIEQGPILEDQERRIGIVQGVQAFKWFNITVSGRDTHAGTTPFTARMDSMLCAAKLIVASNGIAKEHHGLATTGILNAVPGSINTMAHTVTFTLDIRHVDDAKLQEIETACRQAFTRISTVESEKGCKVAWELLVDSPAVSFHPTCISCVSHSASSAAPSLFPSSLAAPNPPILMTSGAGHDSCYTSRRCPTSMIFTPTREGVSHNPREYCADEDCALGAQVLLGAVLRFDLLG